MKVLEFKGHSNKPIFIEVGHIIGCCERDRRVKKIPKTTLFVEAGSESEEWIVNEDVNHVLKKLRKIRNVREISRTRWEKKLDQKNEEIRFLVKQIGILRNALNAIHYYAKKRKRGVDLDDLLKVIEDVRGDDKYGKEYK